MPETSDAAFLLRLAELIAQRKRELPTGSYTTTLFEGGHGAIAAKVREECQELIEAAAGTDRAHTSHEAADLIYHVWVLLEHAGVSPTEVFAELERRFGTSGLDEKRARG